MTTVNLPVEPGWYICYREGSGRTLAVGQRFDSKRHAQAFLMAFGGEFKTAVHIVERKP